MLCKDVRQDLEGSNLQSGVTFREEMHEKVKIFFCKGLLRDS